MKKANPGLFVFAFFATIVAVCGVPAYEALMRFQAAMAGLGH